MASIKTIAIVGATGRMGTAIAKSLHGKYRLLIMSRDEMKLIDLKSELGKSTPGTEVFAVDCAREAAWEADIIIIATPYDAEREIAAKIREVSVGKIVISISNPLDNTYNQLIATEGSSAAEELQKMLPYSKVVKTFNTTFAADFMRTVMDGKRIDAFIAGNDGGAVETVSRVVASAGFSPVVIGDLSMSRLLERMQVTLTRLARERSVG